MPSPYPSIRNRHLHRGHRLTALDDMDPDADRAGPDPRVGDVRHGGPATGQSVAWSTVAGVEPIRRQCRHSQQRDRGTRTAAHRTR